MISERKTERETETETERENLELTFPQKRAEGDSVTWTTQT